MLFEDIHTKSETYQKEGWFILEEENSVFGYDADNTNKLDSEEKFSIYHNKEEAKNNILQTFPFVRVDDGSGLRDNE